MKNEKMKNKHTPSPMRELERTVDLFDELIGAGIYMFRWGEAPSSVNSCVFILLVDMVEYHLEKVHSALSSC